MGNSRYRPARPNSTRYRFLSTPSGRPSRRPLRRRCGGAALAGSRSLWCGRAAGRLLALSLASALTAEGAYRSGGCERRGWRGRADAAKARPEGGRRQGPPQTEVWRSGLRTEGRAGKGSSADALAGEVCGSRGRAPSRVPRAARSPAPRCGFARLPRRRGSITLRAPRS